MTLIDLLILLHYAWIPSDFRETYEEDIKTVFDKYELIEKGKAIISTIQTKTKNKAKSAKRILTKLFYEMSTLADLKSFYVSIAIIQLIYFNI